MSVSYYWILPEVEPRPPRTITTPAGDIIEVDQPAPSWRHCDDPRVHIGKLVFRKFYWAQDPEKVRRVCREHLGSNIIEDEYGYPETGADFLGWIDSDLDHDVTSIGETFS